MSDPTTVGSDQISYKKKVGKLGDTPIYEVGLIGGLHLIMKAGSKSPLGAGPHRAVARHIAKKRNPEIDWTEISKSDYVEPQFYAAVLPKYEQLTDHLTELASQIVSTSLQTVLGG
jgi:hypothetical protein